MAENIAVFHGWEGALTGVARGLAARAARARRGRQRLPARSSRAPSSSCSARGIAGPYGLALGREQYRRVIETAEHGGYPLLDHLKEILGGPIVWAPGCEGAIVLSLRGGDFVLESGQDLSIGYDSHDAERRAGSTSRRASASTSRRPRPAIALTP